MSSRVSGDHLTVRQSDVTVIGNYNSIYGSSVRVRGDYNKVYGSDCRVVGDANEICGDRNKVRGNWNRVTNGKDNEAFGSWNKVPRGSGNVAKPAVKKRRRRRRPRPPPSIPIGSSSSSDDDDGPPARRRGRHTVLAPSLPAALRLMFSSGQAAVLSTIPVGLTDLEIPKEEAEEPAGEDVPDAMLCRVCLDHVHNTLVVDCSHACLCVTCARKILLDNSIPNRCPICKTAVSKGIRRIYA